MAAADFRSGTAPCPALFAAESCKSPARGDYSEGLSGLRAPSTLKNAIDVLFFETRGISARVWSGETKESLQLFSNLRVTGSAYFGSDSPDHLGDALVCLAPLLKPIRGHSE